LKAESTTLWSQTPTAGLYIMNQFVYIIQTIWYFLSIHIFVYNFSQTKLYATRLTHLTHIANHTINGDTTLNEDIPTL
jgi:hypothetical protein